MPSDRTRIDRIKQRIISIRHLTANIIRGHWALQQCSVGYRKLTLREKPHIVVVAQEGRLDRGENLGGIFASSVRDQVSAYR